MLEEIVQRVTAAFQGCRFLEAVVLGGSRATGTATERSDLDIGLYYTPETIDYDCLNAIAQRLDDSHRPDLICRAGGWGPWVNCGGWLTIDGTPVDLILRDMSRVEAVIEATDLGQWACHYQSGHPHAFVDVMYRGELATCRVLYAKDAVFLAWKQRAAQYPPALQEAIASFFLFEADFSCALAEKYAASGDGYYLAGLIFHAVSALNQVCFARSGVWLLNEKKAVARVAQLPVHPADYPQRVARLFSRLGEHPQEAVALLRALCRETQTLCGG